MRDDPEGRVIHSMWHKGRKAFLPWMKEEIMRRANVTPEQITEAVRSGMIRSTKSQSNRAQRNTMSRAIYEITDKGRMAVEGEE